MTIPYAGNELDIFAGARNWKGYWSTLIGPLLGPCVLDVGAGIGATAREFASNDLQAYVALEPDGQLAARMVAGATAGGFPRNFEAQQGTIGALSRSKRFDTILYIDVLEHIEDDRGELERASSHLRDGGCIVVLSPAHQWLYSEFDRAIGHMRRYDKASLGSLKPADLDVERLFYLDSVGMAASLANRFLLRSASPSQDQISLWDGWMIPMSRTIDRLTRFSMGKTIVAVFRKPERCS